MSCGIYSRLRVGLAVLLLLCPLASRAGMEPPDPTSGQPLASGPVQEDSHSPFANPRLILIIDDLGTAWGPGKRAIELPGPVNFAVMPYRPYALKLLKLAQQHGRDTLLHAPMANVHHLALGPGGMTETQSREQLTRVLNKDIDSLPGIIGLNNHMGSLLTQDPTRMAWVMEVAKSRGLMFVDSRTIASTVALKVAEKAGIPALERHVFLDDAQDEAAVEEQFQRALKLAHKDGLVVVIGHPHPTTLKVLERELPQLGRHGIALESLSGYLLQQRELKRLSAPDPQPQRQYNRPSLQEDRSKTAISGK